MPHLPLRSMSFRWRFAVTSGLLLAVVGLVLSRLLAAIIEDRARAAAEQTGVMAVNLALAPNLRPEDLEEPIEGAERRRLDRMMADVSTSSRDGDHPLRVKIFNQRGMIVYSDHPGLVGKTYLTDDVQVALNGVVISQSTEFEDPDEVQDGPVGTALEVYVPLELGPGAPSGVAEIYLPDEPVRAAIMRDSRVVYGVLGGGLLLFYLVMFSMVSTASRRLHDAAQRNEYLAHHDSLTGLPNRALLIERLERAVSSARRHRHVVGLLLIDLDRFKEVNDTLGHDTGDRLLRQVADRIAEQLRDMDTVARLGGDEFVVLLPEVEAVEAAGLVAQRVLDALHLPFLVQGVELAIEASIGLACYPEHGEDQGALLQHADVAMYLAKQARGTFAVYDADGDASSMATITLLNELRRALDAGELVLFYQPKEDLADGTVRGVEALVRWQHPTRGLLGPDEFIPLAEQTGLINSLTTFVTVTALEQIRTWQDEGRDLTVSVNLSARDLMDERLPDQVAQLLLRTGVAPEMLEVEVTETSAVVNSIRASAVLRGLAELGVAITIDDYGTGYSSLSYLRSLPIGTLKIDRSFVTNLLEDQGNAVIVRSTIDLAHGLGLRVVAEGVEDEATHAALAELGCHVAQGYYLSRPVPADMLTALLDDRTAQQGAIVSGHGRAPSSERRADGPPRGCDLRAGLAR